MKRNSNKIGFLIVLEFTFILAQSIPPDITSTVYKISFSNQPYIINSNLTVSSNAKLIIEAGVTLLFMENSNFNLINSTLEIVGNSTNKVYFEQFDQYVSNNQFNFYNSKININYLKFGIKSGLKIDYSILEIQNSEFLFDYGIEINNTESKISNSIIKSSYGQGLSALNGNLSINNCEINSQLSLNNMISSIESLVTDSLYVNGRFQMNIKDSSIRNYANFMDDYNSKNDIQSFYYINWTRNQIRQLTLSNFLKSNLNLNFEESKFDSLMIYVNGESDINIEKCEISSSFMLSSQSTRLNVNLDSNQINSFNAYELYSSSVKIKLDNNSIYTVYVTFSHVVNNLDILMNNNSFENQIYFRCSKPMNLNSGLFNFNYFHEQSSIRLDNCFNSIFRNNIFKNSKCPLSSSPIITSQSNLTLIDAKLNYWNSINEFEIYNRNCYLNDPDQNFIQVFPIIDENYTALNLNEPKVEVNKTDNSIRPGYLRQDLKLTNDNPVYSLNGYLFVSENVSLIIEPGVELNFEQNSGLIIIGNLIIESNSTSKVTFNSFNNPWYGLKFIDLLKINSTFKSYLNGLIIRNCDNFLTSENRSMEINDLSLDNVRSVYISFAEAEVNNLTLFDIESFQIDAKTDFKLLNSKIDVMNFRVFSSSNLKISNTEIQSRQFDVSLKPEKCNVINKCIFEFDKSILIDKGLNYDVRSYVNFYLLALETKDITKSLALIFNNSVIRVLYQTQLYDQTNIRSYFDYNLNLIVENSKFYNFIFGLSNIYNLDEASTSLSLEKSLFETCSFNGLFKRLEAKNNIFNGTLNYNFDTFMNIQFDNETSFISIIENEFKVEPMYSIDSLIKFFVIDEKILAFPNITFNRNKILLSLTYYKNLITTNLKQPSLEIDAKFNYWSSLQTALSIQNFIHDNFFDPSLCLVNFVPFYKDEQMNDLENKPLPPFLNENQIGGRLNRNLNLKALNNSYYQIISDIYVNENIVLTMEPGVVLKLDGNYKIIIDGDLIMNEVSVHVKTEVIVENDYYYYKQTDLIFFSDKSNKEKKSKIKNSNFFINSNTLNSVIYSNTLNVPFMENLTIINEAVSVYKNLSKEISNAIVINKNLAYYRLIVSNDQEDFSVKKLTLNGFRTGLNLNLRNKNHNVYLNEFQILNCTNNFIVSDSLLNSLTIENSLFELAIDTQNYNIYINSATNLKIKNSIFKTIQSIKQANRLNFGYVQNVQIENNSLYNFLIEINLKYLQDVKKLNLLIQSNEFKIENYIYGYQTNTLQMLNLNLYPGDNDVNFNIKNNKIEFKNSYEIQFLYMTTSSLDTSNFVQLNIENNSIQLVNMTSPKFMVTQTYDFNSKIYLNFQFNNYNFNNFDTFKNIKNEPLMDLSSNLINKINFNRFIVDYNKTALKCPLKSGPYDAPIKLFDASRNFFGQNQLDYLKKCKSDSDSNYFDYNPVYLDFELTQLTTEPIIKFIMDYEIIDGYLRQNQVINCNSSEQTVYKVLNNIVIPEYLSLSINGNCRLRFSPGVKIIVYGELVINGYVDNLVYLSSESIYSNYWSGIESNSRIKAKNVRIEYSTYGFNLFDTSVEIDNLSVLSVTRAISMTKSLTSSSNNLVVKNSNLQGTTLYLENSHVIFNNVTLRGGLSLVNSCHLNFFDSYFKIEYSSLSFEMPDCENIDFVLKNNTFKLSNEFVANFNFKNMELDRFLIEENYFERVNLYSYYYYINSMKFISNLNANKFEVLIRKNKFVNFLLLFEEDEVKSIESSIVYIFDSNLITKNLVFYDKNDLIIFKIKNSIIFINNTIFDSKISKAISFESLYNSQSNKQIQIKYNKFLNNLRHSSSSTTTFNLFLNGDFNYDLNYNSFINSRDVNFDLGLNMLNKNVINASFNYWNGFNQTSDVLVRISDPNLNYEKQSLIIEPILTEPYTQNDTNISKCDLSCTPNGYCSEDRCSCYFGYTGSTCSEYKCLNDCNGHGKCSGPNQCSCDPGYSGSDCSKFSCENNCNYNGFCKDYNVCLCNNGWSGKFCNEFICEKNCSNRGVCIGPNKCNCQEGYEGSVCDYFKCDSNCNYRGYCVEVNKCLCSSGWTGETCEIFTCQNNCSDSGECIGPNSCACKEGHTGSYCEQYICDNRCNYKGNCVYYNVCSCNYGWTGDDCSKYDCKCKNGLCNQETQKCECLSENWTGDLCDRCNYKFYGPSCLPETKILNVAPNSIYILPNTDYVLSVKAHNLDLNSTYLCLLNDESVQLKAILINDELLKCTIKTSEMIAGETNFKIKNENKNEITSYDFMLLFYKNCTNNCNSNGMCRNGVCSCFNEWSGELCEIKLMKPKLIKDTNDFEVNEFDDFVFDIRLESGTQPVYYQLVNTEAKLEFVNKTQILWRSVTSEHKVNQITIKASNDLGVDYLTINVKMKPIYLLVLLNLNPNNYLQRPNRILLSGTVRYINDTEKIMKKDLPLRLSIKTNYFKNEISLRLNSDINGVFFYDYYTRDGEHGLYEAYATHPLEINNSSSKIDWKIQGMYLNESYIQLNGYIDDKYEKYVSIKNLNSFSFSNLTFNYDQNEFFDIVSIQNQSSNLLIENLSPNNEFIFGFKFLPKKVFYGQFYVQIKNNEGIFNSIKLSINLVPKLPNLVASQDKFDFKILNNERKFFDFDLSNIGSLTAYNLTYQFIKSQHQFKILNQNNSFNLDINQKINIQFSLNILENDAEGSFTEILIISNSDILVQITIKYFITKSNQVNLHIAIEDEFTYFADTKPFVSNATITLSSPYSDYRQVFISNSTGMISIYNLTERYYNIYSTCDNHVSKSLIWEATSSENYLNVFLERVSVRINWKVNPVLFEDKYEIELSSTFEAYVPMPVIVVTPLYFDLAQLETGLINSIALTITNYGLIRAKIFSLFLPIFETISFEFETPFQEFDLEGNSTVEIRLIVLKNNITNGLVPLNPVSLCYQEMELNYGYDCGLTKVEKVVHVSISKNCGSSSSGGTSGAGSFGSLWSYGGYGGGYVASNDISISTEIPCDSCVASINMCSSRIEKQNCLFNRLVVLVCTIEKFGTCIFKNVTKQNDSCFISIWKNECPEIQMYCLENISKRIYSPFLHREELIKPIIDSIDALDNLQQIVLETYGNEIWFSLDVTDWFQNEFEPLLADLSDQGSYISIIEMNNLLMRPYPENITQEHVKELVERFNNTQYLNDYGELNSQNYINKTLISSMSEKYRLDIDLAAKYGYNNLYDWFIATRDAYNRAPMRQGTCAKIRIVISQSMVLTREGFEATLEIDNQEENDLQNISVVFKITRLNDSLLSNNFFSIGKPKLNELTSVDGNGILGSKKSGVATWLLIPYREAAEFNQVEYYVSGELSYTTGGRFLKTDLSSEKITVHPESRLELVYFLERNVLGDDPFTPEYETPVPFVLGLLISNKGYGAARNLKIESSQPEIVENEKGLLIDFKIENALLDNKQVETSLKVDFGDLASFACRQVIWSLKSSLSGTFKNLSVTYKNTNPNGDPKLSIIDKIEYKQLLKMVRVNQPLRYDDNLLDFLVINEYTLLPDVVYLTNSNVTKLNVTFIDKIEIIDIQSKSLKVFIDLSQIVEKYNYWFYSVVDIKTDKLKDFGKLLKTVRNDQIKINEIPSENIWITKFNDTTSLVHVFDFYGLPSAASNELITYEIISFNEEFKCENNCSNKGECIGPNKCVCNNGLTGSYCESFICDSKCNNHGTCVSFNTCTCESGWTGYNCSQFECKNGCNNNGTCIGPNECKCTEDWSGFNCDFKISNHTTFYTNISTTELIVETSSSIPASLTTSKIMTTTPFETFSFTSEQKTTVNFNNTTTSHLTTVTSTTPTISTSKTTTKTTTPTTTTKKTTSKTTTKAATRKTTTKTTTRKTTKKTTKRKTTKKTTTQKTTTKTTKPKTTTRKVA